MCASADETALYWPAQRGTTAFPARRPYRPPAARAPAVAHDSRVTRRDAIRRRHGQRLLWAARCRSCRFTAIQCTLLRRRPTLETQTTSLPCNHRLQSVTPSAKTTLKAPRKCAGRADVRAGGEWQGGGRTVDVEVHQGAHLPEEVLHGRRLRVVHLRDTAPPASEIHCTRRRCEPAMPRPRLRPTHVALPADCSSSSVPYSAQDARSRQLSMPFHANGRVRPVCRTVISETWARIDRSVTRLRGRCCDCGKAEGGSGRNCRPNKFNQDPMKSAA